MPGSARAMKKNIQPDKGCFYFVRTVIVFCKVSGAILVLDL